MRYWIAFFLFFTAFSACAEPMHGIAMHGKPKYPKEFPHFDYVNPMAPKGGVLKQASFGSFDTFNPFVIKGNSAPGIGMLFETLMTSASDEPFSAYGLLAQTIEVPEDRSWVAFTLKPHARFHDETPITADDIVFSFNILKEKGVPQFRYYYGSVEKVEKTGDLSVKFTFLPGDNRELPLILGQMPILSKKDWENKDFTATTLTIPVGSGPYLVKNFEVGRFISYQRNPNYWGKDEPVNIGQHNFDEIRYDIYRDTTVAVEALKSGAYDVRIENEAKKWATAYEGSDLQSGKLVKKSFKHALPSGMQGFVFNTRRPLFQDVRIREALGYALNFNWINQNLFYDSYTRTQSYFDNSDLGAKGLPTDGELALLEP
ncbi:MAG: ABC transporter substrate-binding protein, partial [Alphaproteobacteria bacterium]|nr:ABC transporter substrate-binding protein [Alphaproteobacteria bacterium]